MKEEAVSVNFDRFAREWEAGEAERAEHRAACHSEFDRIRDCALARIWGELK